jgi:hypothetical protein
MFELTISVSFTETVESQEQRASAMIMGRVPSEHKLGMFNRWLCVVEFFFRSRGRCMWSLNQGKSRNYHLYIMR